MSKKVDLILLQCAIEKDDARTLLAEFRAKDVARKITVVYSAWTTTQDGVQGGAQNSAGSGLLHVYLKLNRPRRLTKEDIRKTGKRWAKICKDPQATASRLHKVFETTGAATGQKPAFHYVVETTPEKGWFKEISAWYDQEHMPGLAAVPGCIHAVRMINMDHGPKSFACYDLVDRDVMGSGPWLKVRATDWSSKCRPHFTNTRRNMFEVL